MHSYDFATADPRNSVNYSFQQKIASKIKLSLVRTGQVQQDDDIHSSLQRYVAPSSECTSSSDEDLSLPSSLSIPMQD